MSEMDSQLIKGTVGSGRAFRRRFDGAKDIILRFLSRYANMGMTEQEGDERQTRSVQSAKLTLPPAMNEPVNNTQEIFMDEIPEVGPRVF